MKLIWVRHGETLWNRQYRLQGLSDVALSELGCRQAEQLAAAFLEKPAHIFVSPLQRAQTFAAPLATRFELPLQLDDNLREMSFGQWEGLSYAEMDQAMQKQFAAWCNDPVTNTPPAGEGAAALAARVDDFLQTLVARLEQEETAVIVTHGGVIRTAVTLAMQMPAAAAGRLQIDTASLTTLYNYNNCWYLAKLNDTSHLQERV
ncbi:MAG TPA: histidine phosphatase family protein [Oscillospiraceae bacterium]|nr:histidine phosphatase family protein [Oscillospiraceae bacterium]